MCIASGKSRSAKGASRQPAFMDSCLTCVFPVYLVDRLIFICFVLLPYSHSGAGSRSFDVSQGIKLCCIAPRKGNVSRVSLQKFDIRYLIFAVTPW